MGLSDQSYVSEIYLFQERVLLELLYGISCTVLSGCACVLCSPIDVSLQSPELIQTIFRRRAVQLRGLHQGSKRRPPQQVQLELRGMVPLYNRHPFLKHM